jgi:hypothetical protein
MGTSQLVKEFDSVLNKYRKSYHISSKCSTTSQPTKKRNGVEGSSVEFPVMWSLPLRSWVFRSGPLKGEQFLTGWNEVIHSLLRKRNALLARRALHEGCVLVLRDVPTENTVKFVAEQRDEEGAYYQSETNGGGWLECRTLNNCPEIVYVEVLMNGESEQGMYGSPLHAEEV